jgi:uncharacterized membrane protein
MKKYFLPLFLIVIVLAIVDAPIQSAHEYTKPEGVHFPIWIEVLGLAYWLLFAPVIEYSADLLFVQAVRGIRIDVKNIIAGFNNYLNVVLANLLVMALVGIATVALIIPGIIVGCRLAFVSYLVMDKNYDPITAVETSWKMTRGHGWKIFGLGFISIFIFIAGLALFIVGILPAIMWIKASFASLYQAVLTEVGDDFFVQIEAEKNK